MKRSCKRLAGVYLAAVLASLTMSAEIYAATMDVLLKEHDLRLEYSSGATIVITFDSDGTYTTNTGSSGTWTLEGQKLCTVRSSDSVSGCGRLPRGKSRGRAWTSVDANGVEVTASIVKRRKVRGR